MKPILFSAPMVQALLAGRKTQTRRIMKSQPMCDISPEWPRCKTFNPSFDADGSVHCANCGHGMRLTHNGAAGIPCPYGKPGDRLWVRELWTGTWDGVAVHLHYAADGAERLAGEAPTEYVLPKAAAKVGNWVTPLFMPRWASRITLEITEVRVQRLQEISCRDLLAEGSTVCIRKYSDGSLGCVAATEWYRKLWESLNGADSWATNPWVWAVSFKVIL